MDRQYPNRWMWTKSTWKTHRDLLIVDDATLEQAKKYFHDRGIETAGRHYLHH